MIINNAKLYQRNIEKQNPGAEAWDFESAYIKGANDTLEEVCKFLKETFYDDHSDATYGVACLFPDVILTDKFFTVSDLIEGLKKTVK